MYITHIIYLGLIGTSNQFSFNYVEEDDGDIFQQLLQRQSDPSVYKIIRNNDPPPPSFHKDKTKLLTHLSKNYMKNLINEKINEPLDFDDEEPDIKKIQRTLTASLLSLARNLEESDGSLFKNCSKGRRNEIALCVPREECTSEHLVISLNTYCESNTENVVCCVFNTNALRIGDEDNQVQNKAERYLETGPDIELFVKEVSDKSVFSHLDIDDENRDVLLHLMKLANIDKAFDNDFSEYTMNEDDDLEYGLLYE